MQYRHHDFVSNFDSSVNVGDKNYTMDLFANELSDMVVYETPSLVSTLNKVGLDINEQMSDEEIVDKIIEGSSKDEKIVKSVAYAIAESNGVLKDEKKTKDQVIKIIKSIAVGLTPVSKEISGSSEKKEEAKKKIMTQIESKAARKGDYKRKIWKNGIGGSKGDGLKAILVIAVVSVISYLVYKHFIKTPTPAPIPNV